MAAILLFSCPSLRAQWNLPDNDDLPYHFGITFAYTQAHFHLDRSPYFLHQDSVMVVQPSNGNGFALGLIGTKVLTKRFDIRFNPVLNFAEKNIHYEIQPDSFFTDKKLESILLSFPLQVRLKSDRIGNFRLYTFAGIKLDDNINPSTYSDKENLVEQKKIEFGYEGGIGFQFYLPYVVISPELKFSYSIGNSLVKNPNIYSDVIERLQSRMVMLSIQIER